VITIPVKGESRSNCRHVFRLISVSFFTVARTEVFSTNKLKCGRSYPHLKDDVREHLLIFIAAGRESIPAVLKFVFYNSQLSTFCPPEIRLKPVPTSKPPFGLSPCSSSISLWFVTKYGFWESIVVNPVQMINHFLCNCLFFHAIYRMNSWLLPSELWSHVVMW
jgi:hypothetical protein